MDNRGGGIELEIEKTQELARKMGLDLEGSSEFEGGRRGVA